MKYIITEEHLRNYRRGTITFEDIEEYAHSHPYKSEREADLDELQEKIDKQLEHRALINGGTQGLSDYLLMKDLGKLKKLQQAGRWNMKVRCPVCNGTGKVPKDFGLGKCKEIPKDIYYRVCPGCDGTGIQWENRDITSYPQRTLYCINQRNRTHTRGGSKQ